jgi:hypothetical protein
MLSRTFDYPQIGEHFSNKWGILEAIRREAVQIF